MSILWLAAIVFVSYGVGAMTGFGAVVLALSVGALFYDLQSLVIILVPLTVLMNLPLAWLNREHIDWQLLLKQVLPFMGAGLVVGFVLPGYLSPGVLQLIFAALILWFSIRSLLKAKAPKMHPSAQKALFSGAGVIHGMYASGGPLLVYALARANVPKAAFRASLVFVWLSMNSVLTTAYFIDGRIFAHWQEILWLVPAVYFGAYVGNKLHHKVDEAKFLRIVFWVLALVGLLLTIRALNSEFFA